MTSLFKLRNPPVNTGQITLTRGALFVEAARLNVGWQERRFLYMFIEYNYRVLLLDISL